jgi:hypothetical protein
MDILKNEEGAPLEKTEVNGVVFCCCWMTNLKLETWKEEEEIEARRFKNMKQITDELVIILCFKV